MPISSFQNRLWEWSDASIAQIENRPGVYEFYDTLEMILFVGTTEKLRDTLKNYYDSGFSENPCLRETSHFRVDYVEDLSQQLKHHITVYKTTSGGQMPECMQE